MTMLRLKLNFWDIVKFRDTEPVELGLGIFTVLQSLWLTVPGFWYFPVLEKALQSLPPFRWLLLALVAIGIFQITAVLLFHPKIRMVSAFACFMFWMYIFLKFMLDGLWGSLPVSFMVTSAALWIAWRLSGAWRQ